MPDIVTSLTLNRLNNKNKYYTYETGFVYAEMLFHHIIRLC